MVFEKVKEIVIDSMGSRLKVCEDDINSATNFKRDLHTDSVDIANIITSIEDEFDIVIDDETLDNMNTIGDAVSYIEASV